MYLRLKDKKVSNDSRWEQRGVELPGGSAESIALSLLSRSVFKFIFLSYPLFSSLLLPLTLSVVEVFRFILSFDLLHLCRVGSGRLPPADQLTWLVSRDEVDQVQIHKKNPSMDLIVHISIQ